MGNLLFSPSGRIGPAAFMKGMLVLAAISAALSFLPFISDGLVMIVGILSLVLYVPLVFLGIKRSHDAGRSGWFSIVLVLITWGVGFVLGLLLLPMFMGSAMDTAAIEAASETGDMSAVFDAAGEMAKKTAIPSAIASLVSFAVSAFIFNAINKSDPGDNQYGPATLGDS